MKFLLSIWVSLLFMASGQQLDLGYPVTFWNTEILNAIAEFKTVPPLAARALMLLHWAQDRGFKAVTSVSARKYARKDDGPVAIGHASYTVICALYPSKQPVLDGKMKAFLASYPKTQSSARQAGINAAFWLLQGRTRDGSTVYKEFQASTQNGYWQPTGPAFQQFPILPNFGNAWLSRITNIASFILPAPPKTNSEEFKIAYKNVYELGRKDSTTRTPEQSDIARFWVGEGATPPGMWNKIAQTLVASSNNATVTLHETLDLFRTLNVALYNAAVICWRIKYTYKSWRPITAISGDYGNFHTINGLLRDPSWTSYLDTPPFPEYVSGHSTFSGAAARVLQAHFGNNVTFTHTASGVARTFTALDQAAFEAGNSRIYGGIHFDFSNRPAVLMGVKIADAVFAGIFEAKKVTTPFTSAGNSTSLQ